MATRDRVFVSYSHRDTDWFERLKKLVDVEIRNRRVDYFHDRQIQPGDDWYQTIVDALDRARAAVLLVSPNFLASRFIMEEELPRILKAAEKGELTILWVPIAGAFPEALSRYQAFGDSSDLFRLCREINRILSPGRIPRNLPFKSLGELFVGREKDLEAIRQSSEAHIVRGLGGVGKTRLAVEYAWRNEDRFSAYLFARASTPQELKSNLASLCRPDALDLPEQHAEKTDDQCAAAVRWLQDNRNWLLILDNVDSKDAVDAVEELVANLRGGQIVITSRISEWSAAFSRNELRVLDPDAARELIVRRSEAKDTDQAGELAKKLGFLPLALEIAAAYIKQRRLGIADYLGRYEKYEAELLKTPAVEKYPDPVYFTWQTSVEQLTPEARLILELHAFMASTPCPIALYEPELDDHIVELCRYSLAERIDADSFTVHPLIQAVERHKANENTLPTVQDLLIKYGGTPSWEPSSRALWDLLLPHAEAVSAGNADILWRIAGAYKERGDYRSAIPPWRECLAIDERTLGTEHPNTLQSVNNLAALLELDGDYAAAEPLYRRALEASERVLGSEHRYTLIFTNGLASVLESKGDFAAAETIQRRAVAASERVMGSEDLSTLTSVSNLAYMLARQGNYAAAEPLYRRALAAHERVLGTEHPDTLTLINNLAELLRQQGVYATAEPLHRRALEVGDRVLGPEHPATLISVNNLAHLLYTQGNYAAAEPLFRRAVEGLRKILGPDHPHTKQCEDNLARCLSALQPEQPPSNPPPTSS
jgi:tetratricopeptide (TPR) repeat protein